MPEQINPDRGRYGGHAIMGIVDAVHDILGSTGAASLRASVASGGVLASLGHATDWLNWSQLTAASLRGKVVLIDFRIYTCINWLRTLPYIRARAKKYKDRGLVVIGVHTPEFPFDRNVDNRHVYSAPVELRLYQWALSGDWRVEEQDTVLNKAPGRIECLFHVRDLHLVTGPRDQRPVRFRVLVDGHPPGAAHGSDVDDQGNGQVTEQRLYQLVPGARQENLAFTRTCLGASLCPTWLLPYS